MSVSSWQNAAFKQINSSSKPQCRLNYTIALWSSSPLSKACSGKLVFENEYSTKPFTDNTLVFIISAIHQNAESSSQNLRKHLCNSSRWSIMMKSAVSSPTWQHLMTSFDSPKPQKNLESTYCRNTMHSDVNIYTACSGEFSSAVSLTPKNPPTTQNKKPAPTPIYQADHQSPQDPKYYKLVID